MTSPTSTKARSFQELFGADPRVSTEAHGRVNLIGEHTDYNGGYVLPTAIPQKTSVELSPREGRLVRVASSQQGDSVSEYRLGAERLSRGWTDYVQGVTHVLARRGHAIQGFDARIHSTVPIGSGLSSSAALEVSLLRALREAFGLDLDDVEIARLGKSVENDFVGARVGIMDQMAASLANEGEALLIDTRDLSYRRIPLPRDRMDLIVINSGVAHSNVQGDYNRRRAECEEACRLLGVRELRDLDPTRLSELAALPDTLRRRALHVITENQRVLEAAHALEAGDIAQLGRLFNQSHASMRDDYEVSVPEIDSLVEIAQQESDVFGARLTGGGFGGSIVAVCRDGWGPHAAITVAERYRIATRQHPTVLVPQGLRSEYSEVGESA